jgi:hypothetical protein
MSIAKATPSPAPLLSDPDHDIALLTPAQRQIIEQIERRMADWPATTTDIETLRRLEHRCRIANPTNHKRNDQ